VIELPRVKKEDCEIKFIKSENVIQIIGKTELNDNGFSFLENKELELKLKVSPEINISGTNIEASHRNGGLYISISKSLINLNNININILS
jgi:HSP20 family molecular chaperone IbpA